MERRVKEYGLDPELRTDARGWARHVDAAITQHHTTRWRADCERKDMDSSIASYRLVDDDTAPALDTALHNAKLQPRALRALLLLRCGASALRASQHRANRLPDGRCQLCTAAVDETVQHLALQCTAYNDARAGFLNAMSTSERALWDGWEARQRVQAVLLLRPGISPRKVARFIAHVWSVRWKLTQPKELLYD